MSQETDIEIALLDASNDDAIKLQKLIPSDFILEDARDRGWGIVLRRTEPAQPLENIDENIHFLLKPLNEISEYIRSLNGVLRVAVFHDTVNCTVVLSVTRYLDDFGLRLELSTYPVNN